MFVQWRGSLRPVILEFEGPMPEKQKTKVLNRVARYLEAAELILAVAEETDILGKMRRGMQKLNSVIRELQKKDGSKKES
jgi:hypothetical protein